MHALRGILNFFTPSSSNSYRPHLLRRPFLLFFLAIILATEGFLVASLVARQADQNFLAAVVPGEIISLTNAERDANHVGDLAKNDLLTKAAQAKADDMAANQYFSHIGPDGKTPWQWISASGYKYQYAGENLAVRFIDSSDVVNAWMASPTHRENMVKPVYTEIGVGVTQGLFQGQQATYVVQYFGTPATSGAAAPTVSVATPAAPASTPTPAAAQTPAAQPAPAAAAVAAATPAQGSSLTQSLSRQLVRLFANPKQSSLWVLGTISTLLMVALIFTFFTHVQIQPTHMLASGTVVVALALSFLILNSLVAEGGVSARNLSQPAGVVESGRPAVVVGTGESVGYSLFP